MGKAAHDLHVNEACKSNFRCRQLKVLVFKELLPYLHRLPERKSTETVEKFMVTLLSHVLALSREYTILIPLVYDSPGRLIVHWFIHKAIDEGNFTSSKNSFVCNFVVTRLVTLERNA